MPNQIIKYILERFKRGCQYKKIGTEISQKSNKSNDGLFVGAKIEYNARSIFHTTK